MLGLADNIDSWCIYTELDRAYVEIQEFCYAHSIEIQLLNINKKSDYDLILHGLYHGLSFMLNFHKGVVNYQVVIDNQQTYEVDTFQDVLKMLNLSR